MYSNNLILGQDQCYSLNTHETGLNNNVLVVGGPGSGKTRGLVIPNLLEATGSYVVSDPKGDLYKKYKSYLEDKGYRVRKIDFTDPEKSIGYNFFEYIRNTQDIVKIARMLIYQRKEGGHQDPFWDEAGQLLIQSIIGALMEKGSVDDRNMHSMLDLIESCNTNRDMSYGTTLLDDYMDGLDPDGFAKRTYNKFRVAADKTLRSILITVNARIGLFSTPELRKMMHRDEVDIDSIGKEDTALFVVVSDTDRSMDGLVNIFFSQVMNELTRFADKHCEGNCLPVPVRFFLDDFATNCKIEEFPRMIASIRSRGISTMLMIQAESQLFEGYGQDGKTIIGSCDSYVYLGSNDIETAEMVARRCDVPVKKVLYMPVGTNWIFRRGQEPINGKNIDLIPYMEERGLLKATVKNQYRNIKESLTR